MVLDVGSARSLPTRALPADRAGPGVATDIPPATRPARTPDTAPPRRAATDAPASRPGEPGFDERDSDEPGADEPGAGESDVPEPGAEESARPTSAEETPAPAVRTAPTPRPTPTAPAPSQEYGRRRPLAARPRPPRSGLS